MLVIGSVLYSMPFVVQPIRNAFEAFGDRPLEVAATLRASPWDAFWSVAIPLARPGFSVWCHPLLRSPAEIPLMVSWIPRNTCSLTPLARCCFKSSFGCGSADPGTGTCCVSSDRATDYPPRACDVPLRRALVESQCSLRMRSKIASRGRTSGTSSA